MRNETSGSESFSYSEKLKVPIPLSPSSIIRLLTDSATCSKLFGTTSMVHRFFSCLLQPFLIFFVLIGIFFILSISSMFNHSFSKLILLFLSSLYFSLFPCLLLRPTISGSQLEWENLLLHLIHKTCRELSNL